jgi:hypothetical protein
MNAPPHSRFKDRVWIEREVIGLVNRASSHYLHGLSEASIAAWSQTLDDSSEYDRAVIAAVRGIALRSRIHVDTSRDIFDDEGRPALSSIERLVLDLQTLLSAP